MKTDNKEIKAPLLKEISKYIRYILKVMGFIRDEDYDYISNEDTESQLSEAVNVIVNLRINLKKSISTGINNDELTLLFNNAFEELKQGGFFEESKSRSHIRS